MFSLNETNQFMVYSNSVDLRKRVDIKSQEAVKSLTEYITNKQENIPCYAIRKGLGLPSSSNPVEKANDLIVAHRQKGKGMTWSKEGCHALAAITVAGVNNERQDILMGWKPRFAFAA